MNYKLFKEIVHAIQRHENSNINFSKFLEEKICTSSFCCVDYGQELVNMLIKVIEQEFNLQKDSAGYTDITWWLYESAEKKIIYFPDGHERDLTKLKDLYNYMVENKNMK